MKKFLTWFKTTFGDTYAVKAAEKLFFSFDNSNKGLSGKKLTAFSLVYCVIKMHNYYCAYAYEKSDFSMFAIILGADFGFLLALFGINEYGKNKSRTTGTDSTITTETTQTSNTIQ